MSSIALPWNPFEQMDHLRRWQGHMLDAIGLGPLGSPARTAMKASGVTLKAYGEPGNDRPVLLLVPAPIKRAYLWDLVPWASVVQQGLRGRLRVYLVEWDRPGPAEQAFGLAEYADRFLIDCLDTIAHETGHQRAFLAGHSLGGTLAAIFSALHPDRVQGLILLGAPVHFGKNVGDLDRLVAASPDVRLVTHLLGNVPGSLLDAASYLASPKTFELDRWNDWIQSLSDPWALQTHLRVERWTLDESPMPQRLFEETTELLYRQDRFMRGTLEVAGGVATPASVVAPLVTVADRHCRVVPPESVLPFHAAAGSTSKQLLWYHRDTGVALHHVGVLVGRSAHEELWPQIVRWIHQHSEAR